MRDKIGKTHVGNTVTNSLPSSAWKKNRSKRSSTKDNEKAEKETITRKKKNKNKRVRPEKERDEQGYQKVNAPSWNKKE